jgi:hypothetical protein
MLMSRLAKVVYKKQSHGSKSQEKNGKNGKRHVLKGGYGFEN